MSEIDVTIEAPKATLFVERKVSPKQYESLTVGLHFPVELPLMTADDTPASYAAASAAAIAEGFQILKVQVYDQLGIEYTDDQGILKEKVGAAFADKPPARSTPRPVPPSAEQSSSQNDGTVVCPKCKGPVWDNRETKKNPKQPDYKCRDKGCEGVIWPPRGK